MDVPGRLWRIRKAVLVDEHKGLSYRARENRGQAVGGEADGSCCKPGWGCASCLTRFRASAVSLAAVGDTVNGDGVGGLLEEDAVFADTEAEEAIELSGEGLDAARSGLGVAVMAMCCGMARIWAGTSGSKRIFFTNRVSLRESAPW